MMEDRAVEVLEYVYEQSWGQTWIVNSLFQRATRGHSITMIIKPSRSTNRRLPRQESTRRSNMPYNFRASHRNKEKIMV